MSHPVYLVYTYVDGSDPDFVARKNAALAAVGKPPVEAALKGRFEDNGEILYSLRSAEKFLPFVRKVYIVTGSRLPVWLDVSRSDLEVVRLDDLAGADMPVTFNSNGVETVTHRIPGLSEHFILSNDDFFFGRPLSYTDFFTADDKALYYTDFFTSKSELKRKMNRPPRGTYGATRNNSFRAIQKKFGDFSALRLPHIPRPYLKSVTFDLERDFAEEFRVTRQAVFRTLNEYSPTYLFPLYAAAKGRAVIRRATPFVKILANLDRPGLSRKMAMIKVLRPKFFCFSEGPKTPPEVFVKMQAFLEEMFPKKSRFER